MTWPEDLDGEEAADMALREASAMQRAAVEEGTTSGASQCHGISPGPEEVREQPRCSMKL